MEIIRKAMHMLQKNELFRNTNINRTSTKLETQNWAILIL